MQRILTQYDTERVGYPIIGVASTKFSIGDPVYIDSNGFLALATTSSKILGFCIENYTTSASNATTEKYCPQYINAEGVVVAFTISAAVAQTDIGAYSDVATATSGAIVLNGASAATGQFLILGIGPLDNGATTTEVAVSVAEPQGLAFAQS